MSNQHTKGGAHCPGGRIRDLEISHDALQGPKRVRHRHRRKVAQQVARVSRSAHLEQVPTTDTPADPSDIERDEVFGKEFNCDDIERGYGP